MQGGRQLPEGAGPDAETQVLIIDFRLEALESASRLSLFGILEDRHGRASSIIVSQLPGSQWHTIIGDPTIADAICDRIVHTAHRIERKGESVRKLCAHCTKERKNGEECGSLAYDSIREKQEKGCFGSRAFIFCMSAVSSGKTCVVEGSPTHFPRGGGIPKTSPEIRACYNGATKHTHSRFLKREG